MTLAWMDRLASDGAKDLEVRRAALRALALADAPDHEPRAALAALFRFVRDRIRFVPDPVGTQLVQAPRATLELGAGNCAQRATLLAAMARAIGVPAELKFRVIAAHPGYPQAFSHVYVVARVQGKDLALDPTYRRNVPGFEYPGATRIGDYPMMPGVGCCRVCRPLEPSTWRPPATLGALPDMAARLLSRVMVSNQAKTSLITSTPLPALIAKSPWGVRAALVERLRASRASAPVPIERAALPLPAVPATQAFAAPASSSNPDVVAASVPMPVSGAITPAPEPVAEITAATQGAAPVLIGVALVAAWFLFRPRRQGG